MKRIVKYLLPGTLILFSIVLIASSLVYSPEFIIRILRWGDADVYDYLKFPERVLIPADTPFEFSYKLNTEQVLDEFELLSNLDDFGSYLEENRTQAFIVIQDDVVIYERYFNGASRDSVVTSFSIAKSFTSALIGIAISEGHVSSVNDPITEYLPELFERDPAFAKITVRDLLLMSSGIKYSEPPDDAATYYFPDLRELALEKTRIKTQPGETFHYNNFHPLLLGMILERSTGSTVTDYLQNKIWQPIGMEYRGSWSLDQSGFEKMESGINARAIDFAKFGRLFLNNGVWNGTQVIPTQWIEESTQSEPQADNHGYYGNDFIFKDGTGYYQYMWWGIQQDIDNYDLIALGNHGQIIYLSPEKKLMILRFGESYGDFGGAGGWVDLFSRFAGEW